MYLDANFFIIGYLDKGEEGEMCREFITRVVKEEKHAATSILAIDEAVYSIRKLEPSADLKEVWISLIQIPHLTFLPINLESVKHVPELLEKGLKPRDAIHASLLLQYGIDRIATNDSDFDKIKEIKRVRLREI